MIKHIVMWTVQGDTRTDRYKAALSVKSRFEGLVGIIPGLQRLEVGLDISGVEYACDVVLYSEFDNVQSLADYATHPEHLRIREELGDIRTTRFQVDYIPELIT